MYLQLKKLQLFVIFTKTTLLLKKIFLLLLISTAFFSMRILFADTTTYFVSTNGSDQNLGESWSDALATIQQAVELARAGDQIMVGHGEYRQSVKSVRSGKLDAPIRISGVGNVEIKGGSQSRIIEINHNYVILEGVKLNGITGNGNKAGSYRDKLLYIMGQGRDKGVKGVKILNVEFRDAGGECVRLKYFAKHNEIAYSKFYNCGAWDFRFNDGGKNGEAIYIGTSPEQLKYNPTSDPDESNNNWIHDNYFNTKGNECVDVKEHSSYNKIERNACTGQRDSESGGISIRGNNNIVRNNLIYNNKGVGIRLGGDTADQGINNTVIGNWLKNNDYGGLKVMAMPQNDICNNVVKPFDEANTLVGAFTAQMAPFSSCF